MHRDMVVRYFLTASPAERLVMETLMEEIALEGKISFSGPVDISDAQLIVTAILRQLSIRHGDGSPIKLRYTKILTDFAIKAVEDSNLLDLHVPLFTAAFERLWYETAHSSQHDDGESWEPILLYATLLIDASVYVPPQI